MKIDLFEFARQQSTASGATSLADLPRIETPDRGGNLAWTASGSTHGRHGAVRLDLTIDGEVVLICQRCLGPMTEPLHLRPKFLVAADEQTADALDQDDDFDVVVGSAEFDLDVLIEDEVVLALPIAPPPRDLSRRQDRRRGGGRQAVPLRLPGRAEDGVRPVRRGRQRQRTLNRHLRHEPGALMRCFQTEPRCTTSACRRRPC